jgi:hypothetical protein
MINMLGVKESAEGEDKAGVGLALLDEPFARTGGFKRTGRAQQRAILLTQNFDRTAGRKDLFRFGHLEHDPILKSQVKTTPALPFLPLPG